MPLNPLCEVGKACLAGDTDVFYPGDSFFIDPQGMNNWQLFFVFAAYGYVLYKSADMIGDGAELLLCVPGWDKMVGSIVLPILGAIPDGMMVLFSGIGPLVVAQENVAVGVGALAGSTIMLLTQPWILSVYAAQVDYDPLTKECVGYKKKAGKRKTEGPSACQFQEGVTKNAYLMMLTSLSYFVIQIPALGVDDQKTKAQYPSEEAYLSAVKAESSSEHTPALAGLFVSLFFFAFYLYLQFLAALEKEPPISCLKKLLPPVKTHPNMDIVMEKGVLPKILYYSGNFKEFGRFKGGPQDVDIVYSREALLDGLVVSLPKDLYEPLSHLFTVYKSKAASDTGIDSDHMREILNHIGLNYTPDAFKAKFEKFDTDKNQSLDKGEYLKLFCSLLTDAEELPAGKPAAEEPESTDGGDDEEEDEMPDEFKNLPVEEQTKAIMKESFQSMAIGTLLVLVFSDPMVDVLAQIGNVTGVSAFYVSFVLAPLASNASELLSSFKLALKKSPSSITQSLQTLEGAACMNNTFCLGIFFVLIYVQGLAWKFTAETLSILFVQLLVFLVVIKSNTQTMKDAYIIAACYPLSLLFVYGLENFAHLD